MGYLAGTAIFATLFVLAVAAQVRARRFHPALYRAVIVATTTAGTTLADFFDRSLGVGCAGGSSILLALLLASLWVWHRARHGVGGQRDHAHGGSLLLDDDHVVADPEDRAGRLDGRHGRAGL